MLRSFLAGIFLLAMGFASASVRTQTAAPMLSVDDGTRTRPIARLVDGRWLDATACVAARSGSARPERLQATGGLKVLPVRAISPGTPDWLRLVPTILDLFERREREQRLAPDKTSDAPRVVDWIYSSGEGSQRTHYFEASRRVASDSPDVDDDTDPPGTVRIAVAGFLHDAAGRMTPLGTKSELRWEQDGLPAGPSRPDLLPLGIVGDGDRSIWVMNGQSGSSVWFTLYDVSAGGTRTLLTARASRC